LLGERRALDLGPDEDQRAGWRLHRLALGLQPGTAALHEVELLVSVIAALVVLIDDSVARLATGPGVDAEGRDAEVVADWSRRTASVADLVDLVEVRDCVATHRASCIVVLRNPGCGVEASDYPPAFENAWGRTRNRLMVLQQGRQDGADQGPLLLQRKGRSDKTAGGPAPVP